MSTECEVELFALHINFFNLNEFLLSICMQHTDKNAQGKWLLGHFFRTVYCRITGASPGSLPGLCPGPTKRLIMPPRQPATPGNEIQSLHIVLSTRYHFHPCPHDK